MHLLLLAICGLAMADDAPKKAPLHGGVASSITGWTGPVASDGSAFNPGAQLAVRPRLLVSEGPWTLMGFWGVSRTLQGCDVCDDPTTAGGADARYQPLRALDSDDLTVSVARGLGGGGQQQNLLLTMAVIAIVSWIDGKGKDNEKGIPLNAELFKTAPKFNIGAFGIMIVLAALYAFLWN